MDPNAMLAHARERMDQASQPDHGLTECLSLYADAAHAYAELDGWLTGGGFLPMSWAGRGERAKNPFEIPKEAWGTTTRTGCGMIRMDHASPPYGPYCTLPEGHTQVKTPCQYPYPQEHDHIDGRCVPKKEEQ